MDLTSILNAETTTIRGYHEPISPASNDSSENNAHTPRTSLDASPETSRSSHSPIERRGKQKCFQHHQPLRENSTEATDTRYGSSPEWVWLQHSNRSSFEWRPGTSEAQHDRHPNPLSESDEHMIVDSEPVRRQIRAGDNMNVPKDVLEPRVDSQEWNSHIRQPISPGYFIDNRSNSSALDRHMVSVNMSDPTFRCSSTRLMHA